MQIEINIEATIAAALDAALAPDRIRQQIEQVVAKTVDSAINDAFREYSDFGKSVKTAVAGIVPHELSLDGAARWNHAISQYISERLAAVNDQRITQAMAPMLDKLLEQPPAELKVSELVAKAVELWDENYIRGDSRRPTVIIEHGDTEGWYRIGLDPKNGVSRYSCRVQIGVTDAGKVYSLTADGQDVKNTRFAGSFYNFEAYIFQLYTGGTRLVLDTEDFDVWYNERED